MKPLAAAISVAVTAASMWLGWLSRRPVEYTFYRSSIDLMRISGLAIAIGILTIAVAWMALRAAASPGPC